MSSVACTEARETAAPTPRPTPPGNGHGCYVLLSNPGFAGLRLVGSETYGTGLGTWLCYLLPADAGSNVTAANPVRGKRVVVYRDGRLQEVADYVATSAGGDPGASGPVVMASPGQ